MVNRTQALVLGFFLLAVTGLLVILAAAAEIYDQALRLPTRNRAVEVAFLSALLGLVTRLGFGVVRRWRWPSGWSWSPSSPGAAGAGGCLAAYGGPGGRWPALYVSFQGLLGVVQVAIGLAMLADYRRAGVWGSSNRQLWAPAEHHQIGSWCA